MREFELRENNQNWRAGSACLKWCPVQSSQDCSANEVQDAYEPPQTESRVSEVNDGTATTSEDGGDDAETGTGIRDTVIEVMPGIHHNEEPLETPTTTEPEEESVKEGEQEDSGSEIVEVPVDQKVSIGGRRIIKVPCNGNAKPDRTGVCRSVW